MFFNLFWIEASYHVEVFVLSFTHCLFSKITILVGFFIFFQFPSTYFQYSIIKLLIFMHYTCFLQWINPLISPSIFPFLTGLLNDIVAVCITLLGISEGYVVRSHDWIMSLHLFHGEWLKVDGVVERTINKITFFFFFCTLSIEGINEWCPPIIPDIPGCV